MVKKEGNKRRFRGLKIGLGVLVGLFSVIFIALAIVLNSNFLTRMANRYAPEFVDGEVSFGTIKASMFKSFPNLNVSIDDFRLTYPHDRYAQFDSLGIAHHLRESGRGSEQDTLASFKNLSVSFNLLSVLSGKYKFPNASLDGARIFAHQYDSTSANWNMFKFSQTEDTDTTSSPLPHIIIRKVGLTGNPFVTYSNPKDTLFASVAMDKTIFSGKVDIADPWDSRINFSIDSLSIEGRLPADTLDFDLNKLAIKEKRKAYDFMADANAYLATNSLGRLDIPIRMEGNVAVPNKDFRDVYLRDFKADIATLDITGEGDLRMETDSSYIRAELSINDCPLEETIRNYLGVAVPAALKLKTDAKVTLTALCDGWYIPSKQSLPELIAELVIPQTSVEYEGIQYKGNIAADINAETDNYGKLTVTVNQLDARMAGLSLSATGEAEDVFCGDPLFGIDLTARASLDTLDVFLPEGIETKGNIDAGVSGYILLSDMSLYNFSRADLDGHITSKEITVNDAPDSLYAYIDNTNITLGKAGKDSKLGADLLGFKGSVDSFNATLGKSMRLRGRGLSMTAQNASTALSKEYGKEIHPIVGTVGAEELTVFGEDSLTAGIDGTHNSFKYSNHKDNGKTLPLLSFSSHNSRISYKQSVNRVHVNNADFSASAVKRSAAKESRKKHFLDSLQKVYPGVPRDSLISKVIRRRALPEFLSEKDFEKSDIDIQLSESMAKYLNEWNLNGNLKISDGAVITPYYPLRNTIENVDGNFTNDYINLKNLTVKSGESDLSMAGKVSGLQEAMNGKGLINADMTVTSHRINVDEIMAAYSAGSKYVDSGASVLNENVSDDAYMAEVVADSLAGGDSTMALIVLPANINATLKLEGDEIDYSHLNIDWFASDIAFKQRTLQITNTVATSNMGDIYFEGFYSTKTKQDLSAGFDLNMVDITADKVITLFPAVDSIIPMLKSFKGDLDCEMAATSQLDTCMNFIPASINGVLNISGKDLSINDDGGFRKLAKILMFRDKSIGKIDDMSVQGIISNSKLEIFPFVLGVDRYTLAMNGIQNFDQSFKYHVSVLKSPIPFRFGVTLTGNFDNWKYRIGKAKYKSVHVPVFTTELHDMKYNLVGAIHNIFSNGAELAMKQNEAQIGSISEAKAAKGYDGDSDEGDLDSEEMASLEQMAAEEDTEEETND